MTPEWLPPRHLLPLVERLEKFREQPFELAFSVPPRHGKSQLVAHFFIWALLQWPELDICYVTYNAEQAKVASRDALKIADRAGLYLSTRKTLLWATPTSKRLGVQWTGVGGGVAGKGFDLIIVDDPIKDRLAAESPTMRNRTWDYWQSDLYTRLMPGGSALVVHTRWHHDDLISRLTAPSHPDDEEWEPMPYVNIPAILDENTADEHALFPELWPLDRLKKRRAKIGAYAWSSLFQGHPVPRGSTVFGEPGFYDELPAGYHMGQGLDLSYSEKKSSDYSVIVTMLRSVDPADKAESLFYVTRVVRKQMRAPDFKQVLRVERARGGNCRCRIYGAGTELGAIEFLRKADHGAPGTAPTPGIKLEVVAPRGDKFTRAIPFAAAWNAGKVLLPSPELVDAEPEKYAWVNDFLDELKAFTSLNDAHDDQVDAAVSAYDVLSHAVASFKSLPPPVKTQRRL